MNVLRFLISKGRLLFLLLILLAASPGFIFAQSPLEKKTKITNNGKIDIKGYVVDEQTGEPLINATVLVKNSNLGAVTNKMGYFIIIDAPSAKSILKASYIGYNPKEIPFIPSEENLKGITIKLKSSSIQTKEVTVLADEYKNWKTAENVSQITLSPASLSHLPNMGEKDIFRSLQLLPGISSLNDGSSGLYIRGGTPDQNLILLDGITVYHVDHFFGFFSAFNSDAIKDIQVYKGGFEAKFGGRLSSVVDLTGKSGSLKKFQLSLGANLLSANGVAEIPLWAKGSLLLSVRRSYADIINSGFYDKIYGLLTGGDSQKQQGYGRMNGFNQMETQLTPNFYFYDMNAKLSYNLTGRDFVSLSFYNGKDFLDKSQDAESVNLRFGQNSSGSSTRTISDVTDWGNLGASAKWTRQWSDRLFSEMTVSFSHYFSKNSIDNNFDFNVQNDSSAFVSPSAKYIQDNGINDLTFRYDNSYQITAKNKMEFGIWYSDISTDYKYTVNDTLSILSRDQKGYNISSYLQDKFILGDPLDVTLGLRSTYFNPTSKVYLEPRASFQYKLSDLFKLKGAWGKFYQFINRIASENVLEGSRDFWIISGADLLPGSAIHYILGTECETEEYLFSIEGYYKKLGNLLEFSQRVVRSNQSRLLARNNYVANFFQGSGISKGVEFLVQKKFGDFSGWASYTLGKVEYTFPEFDNGKTFPADQDKTHEIKLVGSFETGNWNFSSSWVFSTGMPYTAPEGQYFVTLLDGTKMSYIHVSEKNAYRLPDYHRLDLSASYKFKNRSLNGEFGLSVFNVYNRQNIWYKKYDLSVTPIQVTNVAMLGITPTLFIKLNF
ncbi:MAG: TonB-dependent receptor [Clostridiales bacterium]